MVARTHNTISVKVNSIVLAEYAERVCSQPQSWRGIQQFDLL